MKPFVQGTHYDNKQIAVIRQEIFHSLVLDKEAAKKFMGREDYTNAEMLDRLDEVITHQLHLPVYLNDKYQVILEPHRFNGDGPEMIHLSIKRLDREPIHDWRDLQEIKNMLVGKDNEGIELYPAESRVIDVANQYHIFVFMDPNYRIPIGFTVGHVSDIEFSQTKQRKRET